MSQGVRFSCVDLMRPCQEQGTQDGSVGDSAMGGLLRNTRPPKFGCTSRFVGQTDDRTRGRRSRAPRSRGFGPPTWPRCGFTLVELLVVVTILGILVAMVVPRLAGRTQQARLARAEADVKANLALALDLFELDNGRYPTTEEGLNALRIKPPDAKNWNGPYLKRDALDPWGRPYRYRYPGAQNPADYDLFSLGPDGSEGTPDDIVSWKGET